MKDSRNFNQPFASSTNYDLPLLVPYPDLQKNVDTLLIPDLRLVVELRIYATVRGGSLSQSWKMLEYQLAEYGILGCKRLASYYHVSKFLNCFHQVKRNTLDLGFPEWWGGPIHDYHKGLLAEHHPAYRKLGFSPRKDNGEPRPWENPDMKERLKWLQPRIRKQLESKNV